jgi:hypothetical protein
MTDDRPIRTVTGVGINLAVRRAIIRRIRQRPVVNEGSRLVNKLESTLGTLNLDFQLWGASWAGNVAERTAILAERGDTFSLPMWDRTAQDTWDEWLVIRGEWERVPPRFALPWMTEHLMREASVHKATTTEEGA